MIIDLFLRYLMSAKKLILLFLSIISLCDCFAQKEWSNWYGDGKNLMTFKNGYLQIVTDFFNEEPLPGENFFNFYNWGKGGISYSDPATGEMKFIISNRVGFNRNYKDFANQEFLRSCPDKFSYHIIPFHNDPDKFYVIQFQDYSADLLKQETGLQVRCPDAIGLGYSIVDLSLNGGLGGFTVQNKVIISQVNAQVTTVRHANGRDVWVIVHPFNADKFNAYLVTDAGIQAPVQTRIGPMVSGNWESSQGTLTASHDGKLLAGISGIYSGKSNEIQLFDFNNATGVLANYRTLPFKQFSSKLQFSPDNTKLYCLGMNAVYQFDLNNPDIGSTQTMVVNQPKGSMQDMQLAPDGKIYITRTYDEKDRDNYKEYTGVIECPDLPKYACNFDPTALSTSRVAFPDLINDFINYTKAPLITTLNLGKDTAICFGELKISAPAGWESYRWNTGETTREITIKKPGIYHVLTGNKGFSCPEAYGYINVTDKAIKLDLGPDLDLCPKTAYSIHINSDYTNVLWENGSHTKDSNIIAGRTIIISANDRNGCYTSDTISVGSYFDPRADFGADTTLCNDQTLLLQLEPRPFYDAGGTFLWQDGSQKDTLRITKSGTYWGQSTYKGCTIRDSIKVNYGSAEQVDLGKDTTLCMGDFLTLKVNTLNAKYTWNSGETASSIMVKSNGTYWVKVNNGSCTVTDTIQVNFQSKPEIFIGNDTTVCDQQKVILQAGYPGATYLWQDNSTQEKFVVNQPGLYWAQVTSNSCSVRDSIRINYKALPILNLGIDTAICGNQSLLLNAAHPTIESYTWQDNSKRATFLATQSGTYSVNVKGMNGCINRDTIKISAQPLPVFSLGSDTVLCETNSMLLSVNLSDATYLWNSGSTAGSVLISRPGVYWLDASQNGCSKRDSIMIGYKPMPTVSLGNDTTLCEGSMLLLNAGNPGGNYLWQDQSKNPVLRVTTPGLYNVLVNADGCIRKDSIVVTYLYKPVFTLGNDTSICKGQSITLRPNILNVSYTWQNGSTAPDYTITAPGTYRLTAQNICGSTSKAIIVSRGICNLYMPNAFTPNRDGLNDLFRVKDPSFIKVFEMTIYNRYGQMVYKSNNPNMGWDGTFKREDQPQGIYVWQIYLVNLDNETQYAKGSILLLR